MDIQYPSLRVEAVIIFSENLAAIPNHEPIKVVYVIMVKEIVESEEKNKED